jgi:hypothetical protein
MTILCTVETLSWTGQEMLSMRSGGELFRFEQYFTSTDALYSTLLVLNSRILTQPDLLDRPVICTEYPCAPAVTQK